MAVDHVQQNAQAHAVRLVHQVLQRFRVAAPRAHCERRRDVVPERAVIRVFLHRHELHGVVPQVFDPGQDVVREFDVRIDFGFQTRHPDVRFVNPRRGGFFRPPVFPRELLASGRVPVNPVVVSAHHARFADRHFDPSRHAVHPGAVAFLHADLHPGFVFDGSGRQGHGPHPELVFFHSSGFRVPLVEVAYKARALRRGRPFAIHDFARARFGEAKLFIALGELQQRPFRVGYRVLAFNKLLPPVLQVALVFVELLVHINTTHAVHGVPVRTALGRGCFGHLPFRHVVVTEQRRFRSSGG
mmetsp:Transcript_4535/g.16815  ORF Transcript_4535/g.16815 Transcript_4535/m.16815 type:complete len:300 (-) Transcript_4535:322-1221(-)